MRGRIRGMLGLILVAVGVGASCDWTDWRDKRPLTFELGARAKNFVLCELLPQFDRICREGFVATGEVTAYSFCGPTVLDGKAKRNMMGSSFKRCPDPLTDAPWASFSDRSFLDRCWSEPNFLSRAGPEVLVAESVTAVRIRVG